jgi:hypothetical protein
LRARAAELFQSAKKDEERLFVEILAKELDAFPPGKLVDSESPDFLVATSQGLIGIGRWLLIVAEGNSASTFFDRSTKTLQHSYRSSFDRIFFLEAFRRKVWELNVWRKCD